jgi:hypothetical protein
LRSNQPRQRGRGRCSFATSATPTGPLPEGAYSIIVKVRAKPGKEAELRAATLPLVAQVRSDPKNLVYFLQEDRAAPEHFILY